MRLNEVAYVGTATEPVSRDKQALLAAGREERREAMRREDYQQTTIRTLWAAVFGLIALVMALATALAARG